jgi:hypothetical protein
MSAEWTPDNEQKLKAAQDCVRTAAEKFGPMGRPSDSACGCQQWPCPCICHRPRKKIPPP